MTATQYLDAESLADVLPWSGLIDALDRIFRCDVVEPTRHHHTLEVKGSPDATLLLMPAWIGGAYLGVKQASVFPGNSARGLPGVNAIYMLSSAKTGEPLVQCDGNELTIRRTAAASALASRYLSRANSRTLLMMGAGSLAPALIDAHRAVRPIETVYVWNRGETNAVKLVENLKKQGVNAIYCAPKALNEVAHIADIISCATLATDPILLGHTLRAGVHIDLVGAFRPSMREADDEVIKKASVFVDTVAGALSEAGDLIQAMNSGALKKEAVVAELAQLCRGQHLGRAGLDQPERQITLFKSTGAAREDLAAAILAYESIQASSA